MYLTVYDDGILATSLMGYMYLTNCVWWWYFGYKFDGIHV